MPIYILQNGRWTYDTERTLQVGYRYQSLYPDKIKVITHIPPQKPYLAIDNLLADKLFSEYEYVIKLDDDVMVLTSDWVDKIIECFIISKKKDRDRLAYVTSLVNNNPYGFKKLIENNKDLSEEYFAKYARLHMVGNCQEDSYNPYRLIQKTYIYGGGFGTIWHLPYVARWIHEKTTLKPENFISIVKGLGIEKLDSRERYSINCIFFEKKLWREFSNGGNDDEHMLHAYCLLNDKTIYADLTIPMVHIAFFSQREEIRDMIPRMVAVYTDYLGLNHPISICSDRMIEIENRLKFIENRLNGMGTGDYEEIKNSLSYKVGRFITWIPRKMYDFLIFIKTKCFKRLY